MAGIVTAAEAFSSFCLSGLIRCFGISDSTSRPKSDTMLSPKFYPVSKRLRFGPTEFPQIRCLHCRCLRSISIDGSAGQLRPSRDRRWTLSYFLRKNHFGNHPLRRLQRVVCSRTRKAPAVNPQRRGKRICFPRWRALLCHGSTDVDQVIGDDADGQRELHWSTNRI